MARGLYCPNCGEYLEMIKFETTNGTLCRMVEPEPEPAKEPFEFETINGMLCRMVKPEPLTENAQFPCLVRLIQDDSPMGRMNRHYKPDTELEKHAIVSKLSDSKLTIIGDKWNGYDIFNHEIIGYPVVDGSNEWALYQMMQGNKVRHKSYVLPNTHCTMNEKCQIAIFTTPSSMIYGGDVVCHANDWLTSRQVDTMVDERTGWQLYKEPEPAREPIADCDNCKHRCPKRYIDHCQMYEPKPIFKVGDWVEWCGDQYMVESAPPQSGGRYDIRSPYDELGCSVYPENITRKLSPSEVIVTIGCLSGTVSSQNDICFTLKSKLGLAVIQFAMLDKETRELVESLLKAQEEEE